MNVQEMIDQLEAVLAADEADGVEERTVIVSKNDGTEYEVLGLEPDDSDSDEPFLMINAGMQV